MTTLASTAGDRAMATSGIGAQFKPFEHHGMYAFLARARAEEPVFFCPEINHWVVTTREDILPMLRDATRFSADIALAPVVPLVPEALAILKAGMGAEPTMVNGDPPKHDRLRQIAGRFLNAKRFQMLEPDIRRLAREALYALEGRAEVDLVTDLVYEFPAQVLFLLMGIPADEAPRIKRWSDYRLLITFGDLSPEEQLRGAQDMVAYWRYCVALVEDRLRRPLSDYASFLIEHRGEVEPALSDNEIMSLVFGLLQQGTRPPPTSPATRYWRCLATAPAGRRSAATPPSFLPRLKKCCGLPPRLCAGGVGPERRRWCRESPFPPTPTFCLPSAPPTMMQGYFPSPTASTSGGRMRTSMSPSARVRTFAWVHPWPD